jgi:hypothetical protein
MNVGFQYAATPPSDSVLKSLETVTILERHVCVYIITEHKVIFLSEERHQLLRTVKQRNLDIFLEKIPLFKS